MTSYRPGAITPGELVVAAEGAHAFDVSSGERVELGPGQPLMYLGRNDVGRIDADTDSLVLVDSRILEVDRWSLISAEGK